MLLRENFGLPPEVNEMLSHDIKLKLDVQTQELITTRLLAAFPDHALYGEEGIAGNQESEWQWIVDPIDGTVNFLYGIPQYAVSIAAELHGEVVAGVVLNVAAGAEYTATAGGPAQRDGVPIRVRAVVPLAERLIGTGFSYEAHQRQIQAAALLRLLPRIRDIRRLGSFTVIRIDKRPADRTFLIDDIGRGKN